MKPNPNRKPRAFTFLELLLVITILLALIFFFVLPFLARPKAKAVRINCVNNLKEIGTGYRLWANDNGDLVPYQQSVAKGGWKDFLTNANQGAICWTNYAIMQNELGQSPKLLICPADERTAAFSFTNRFGNTNVSYFVGVNANDVYPQSLAGGDRNLGPGTVPARDYGYSPTNGLGNDVAVPLGGPVRWTLKIHSAGGKAGAGNILLGDGSSQQTSSAGFGTSWLNAAVPTTNWPAGHVPPVPSSRLVFP